MLPRTSYPPVHCPARSTFRFFSSRNWQCVCVRNSFRRVKARQPASSLVGASSRRIPNPPPALPPQSPEHPPDLFLPPPPVSFFDLERVGDRAASPQLHVYIARLDRSVGTNGPKDGFGNEDGEHARTDQDARRCRQPWVGTGDAEACRALGDYG